MVSNPAPYHSPMEYLLRTFGFLIIATGVV
jgi:hypothetical protein